MIKRREFLRKSLKGAGLTYLTSKAFIGDLVAQSAAEVLSSVNDQQLDSPTYVHFNFFGAPPRWYFDLFLKPKENSSFQSNPMTATHFSGVSSQGYKSMRGWAKYRGISIPPLWTQKIISPREKNIPLMTDLLDNSLIFRGVKMGIDGHEINNRRLMMPSLNVPSLHGTLTDFSDRALPSINLLGQSELSSNALSSYLSKNNVPPINIMPKGDVAKDLFGNFLHHDWNEAVEHGISDFLKYNAPKNIQKRQLNYQDKIRKLSKSKIEQLISQYPAIFKKYDSIIKQCLLSKNIKGVTDKKISGLDSTKKVDTDFAKRYQNEDYYLGGEDLRDTFKTSRIDSLAEQFALTELLVLNGMSRCVASEINTITNLKYENCLSEDDFEKYSKGKKFNLTNGSKKDYFFDLDPHFSGEVPHLLYANVFWFTFASCLSEFVLRLKETPFNSNSSVFDKTLIHLVSEFDREPNPNLSGSEHGWNGHTSTLISGMFEGFNIRGNIKINSSDNMFKNSGTWGESATIKELDGQHLVYGNIASSLASILEIPSSTPKDESLVKKIAGGKVISHLSECENV